MPGARLSSDQRLSLIVDTRRMIAAAGDDLQSVMQQVAERSQAIIGGDGSMVNLVDGGTIHTRAVTGIAAGAFDARRPLAGSVARYAIESRQPLLIEDTVGDHPVNQELR